MEEVDVGLILFYNERDNSKFDLNNLSLISKSDFVTTLSATSHNLVLQFYLVGTSRRNLFPRLMENQLPAVTVTDVSDAAEESVSEQAYPDEKSDNLVVTTKRARSESFNLTKVTMTDNSVAWTCKTFSVVGQNKTRTPAGVVLEKEIELTRNRILNIVYEAKKHCRQEDLWRRLVKGECSDVVKLEFDELLELMKSTSSAVKRLVDLDPQLCPILANMSITWFQGLTKYLLVRFGDANCKLFESVDQKQQFYIILNPKNLKIFVCLKLNLGSDEVDLLYLYQDAPKKTPSSSSSSSSSGGGTFVVQSESGTTLFNAGKNGGKGFAVGNAAVQHSDILNEIAMQELVQGTINAILYFLWTSLL